MSCFVKLWSAFTFTFSFCPKWLTIIHTYIHTLMVVAALQGPNQHIRSSLGLIILPKDTLSWRPGDLNQWPSNNKMLAFYEMLLYYLKCCCILWNVVVFWPSGPLYMHHLYPNHENRMCWWIPQLWFRLNQGQKRSSCLLLFSGSLIITWAQTQHMYNSEECDMLCLYTPLDSSPFLVLLFTLLPAPPPVWYTQEAGKSCLHIITWGTCNHLEVLS